MTAPAGARARARIDAHRAARRDGPPGDARCTPATRSRSASTTTLAEPIDAARLRHGRPHARRACTSPVRTPATPGAVPESHRRHRVTSTSRSTGLLAGPRHLRHQRVALRLRRACTRSTSGTGRSASTSRSATPREEFGVVSLGGTWDVDDAPWSGTMNDAATPQAETSERTPLLRLPFDQYQRYQVAAELLAGLGVARRRRVLEVGGAPGPVEGLPRRRTTSRAPTSTGDADGRFVVADGARAAVPRTRPSTWWSRSTRSSTSRRTVRATSWTSSARVAGPRGAVARRSPTRPRTGRGRPATAFIRRASVATSRPSTSTATTGCPVLDETVARARADGWNVAVLPSGYLPALAARHALPPRAAGHRACPSCRSCTRTTTDRRRRSTAANRPTATSSWRRPQRPAAELDGAVAALRSDEQDAGAARVDPGRHRLGASLARRLPAAPGVHSVEAIQVELTGSSRELADLDRQIADREAHLAELASQNLQPDRRT